MSNRSSARVCLLCALALCSVALPAAAQAPATEPPEGPPPLWAGSVGAGLAVTAGNRDTSTINLAYEVKRDGGRPITFKSTGLYLRGQTDDELTVDRALLENRGDYRLTDRLSAFGQLGYVRDRFKEIDYLLSPTTGVSYAIVKSDRVELTGDGSLGMVWEKNTGVDLETDGAVLAGEKFLFKLSDTASITQSVSALWKMDDFADSLFTFGAGVTSSLTTRSELKAELLDTYKRLPPDPTVDNNDIALLVSLVYKF